MPLSSGLLVDAQVADAAGISPGKLANPRATATVEELFFVSQPANLTAGAGASLEVLIGEIPIAGRLDSLHFTSTAAAPSNTGSNGWRFTPRRKRVVWTGASSTKSITSVDLQNIVYSKAWLAYEGCTLDNMAWSSAYTYANGAFFAPRDVLTVLISAVGTPADSIAGLLFSVRIVPL